MAMEISKKDYERHVATIAEFSSDLSKIIEIRADISSLET